MGGQAISIRNIVFLSIIIAIFLTLCAVSAVDNSTIDDGQEIVSSSDDEVVIKGKYVTVKLTDDNGIGIPNKTINIRFNGVINDVVTDKNGIAKLKINAEPREYSITYAFKETGYTTTLTKKILVLSTSTSKIKASDYTAYIGVTNTFTVILTAGGIPLEARSITFKVNGKTYTKKTNANGEASLGINLPKGTYKISYSYDGENNINKTSGLKKITVKKGVPVKISKYYSTIYRNKKTSYFKIKVVDVRGNPLVGQKLKFKANKKTYTKKISKKGIASLKIKLKTGSYKIKVSFSKTSKYNKKIKTYTIKVKPKHARNNGIWLFGADMETVDFKMLQEHGTKHIFLNFKAIELHGKKRVESWIKEAKSHKIKVHIWMQVFYGSGKWKLPIKNGKINYQFINEKVKEAKSYSKIKGVAGVHFDYIRFPGNAYQYNHAIKAVNLFTKKASSAVHGTNKKLIVSAAVMPEPSSMKKYYAQDIPTMSKSLDVIVPMVYKGNYHADSAWIKQVTKTFVKQSKKAKIWTGLQTYKSDSKLKKLSAKELMNDADSAALGGAYGVIMFRYGLLNFINFNEV